MILANGTSIKIDEAEGGPYAHFEAEGSVPTGPLQPLPIAEIVAEGFRITPCNLSESVC
mgnify:CR=1 FL=1